MKQEISEVAVEMNSIFDNMATDVLNRIPLEIRDYFKNNASSTYDFEYDKTKRLSEQNIKDKTRGILVQLYRDYVCDDSERKEFNDIYTKFLNKKDKEKRALYNPNDIFKKIDIESHKKNINYLENVNNKPNILKRIINKILNLFK